MLASRCANASDSTANKGLLTAQTCPRSETSLSRQQVLGVPCAKALPGCILYCCTTVLHYCVALLCRTTVLLQKLCTTDDIFFVTPRTLTNTQYWFLCLLHAAQLPSLDGVSNPVLLGHSFYRPATSATVVSRGGELSHSQVYCLTCCGCSHRRNGTAIRSQYCRPGAVMA